MTKNESKDPRPGRPGWIGYLLRLENRGLLLDTCVFAANVFLMRLLVRYFFEIVHDASRGDRVATVSIALYCLAIFLFPPVGAVLKRWRYHQRKNVTDFDKSTLAGCLFNPIFCFCLMFTVFALIDAYVLQYLSPEDDFSPGIFMGTLLLGTTVTIVHTWLVYRYFTPPKNPPASGFLRSPASELVGDILVFANMLNFQIIWNTLSMVPFGHSSGVEESIGRLMVLSFIALLIYFPPRMFYLVDDIGKRRTWLTMLLANSPVLYHVLIGTKLDLPFGW